MKRILFACVENSCRSQMAEAFGHMYRGDDVAVYSGGSKASGQVNPKAITAMAELGYDMLTHDSVSIEDLPDGPYEFLITMGCGEECPYVNAKHVEDWAIPDPKHMDPVAFNAVRDDIGARVKDLLGRLSPPQ